MPLASPPTIITCGPVFTAQHVDETQFLRCASLALPGLRPLHGRLVGTHWRSARIHAGPSVVSLLDDLHLAVRTHVQDRCMLENARWGSILQLGHEFLVINHCVLCMSDRDRTHDGRSDDQDG